MSNDYSYLFSLNEDNRKMARKAAIIETAIQIAPQVVAYWGAEKEKRVNIVEDVRQLATAIVDTVVSSLEAEK